jgi:hypothetical protein
VDGSWVYYSFAPLDSYTITCSLQISSGTITSGTCVQSGGQSFAATGSLSIAKPQTHAQFKRMQRPLKSVDQSACSITGTINYADINLTETLTNLTITHYRDEIVGVGTNSFNPLSVTFVRSGGDHSGGGDD